MEDHFTRVSKLTIWNQKYSEHAGEYSCIVKDTNSVQVQEKKINLDISDFKKIELKGIELKTKLSLITAFIIVVIVIILLVILLRLKVRNEKLQKLEFRALYNELSREGKLVVINPHIPISDQTDILPYDSKFEIDKSRFKLGETVGIGNFGRVVKAEVYGLKHVKPEYSAMKNSATIVAVKMVKERSAVDQLKSLIAELKILIHIGHHINIVNLIAACTSKISKGELYVIIEYCSYDDLRQYLFDHRSQFIEDENGNIDYVNINNGYRLIKSDLISYALQIAKGMAYLISRKVSISLHKRLLE